MVTVIHETTQPKLRDIEFIMPGDFFLSEGHLFVYLGDCIGCDLDSSNHQIVQFENDDVVELRDVEIKVLKD